MPMVPAICTQCGAQIEVDNTHEAGICKHCGTAFITEKAINNYTTNITHHHHFDGATVHMNVESELERLVTAADTFRKMGQNYNAARNYSEIFQKYPQDPRGWIGFIYTETRYKDLFETPPEWNYTYAHFSGQTLHRWDKSLVNDHFFKTAWQVADPDTRQQLTDLADQYIKNCNDYEKQIQQKTAEHKANYSLGSLKRYIGDDIYLYQCIETSLDLLYILDDKLYFQNICLHDSSKDFSHAGVLGELTSMDSDGIIYGKGIYCSNILTLQNLDYYEDDIIAIHKPGDSRILDHTYRKIPNGSKEYDKLKGFISKAWDYKKTQYEKNNRKGCYIATCVYGSYDCPQVWTLRRFRDYTLDHTWYGRLFIQCYYTVSPTLVRWFGGQQWFQRFWKKHLDSMITSLKQQGVKDTPYTDKY